MRPGGVYWKMVSSTALLTRYLYFTVRLEPKGQRLGRIMHGITYAMYPVVVNRF
jgi:hypothetical protein